MQSVVLLNIISEKLANQNINSFSDIIDYYNKGLLTKLCDSYHLDKIIKDDFITLLELLFDENNTYRNELFITNNYSPYFCWTSQYILALYLGNVDSYRNFPKTIKAAIDKFGLYKYRDVTLHMISERVKKVFNISEYFDPNRHEYLCEIREKIKNEKYDIYENTFGPGKNNPLKNKAAFSIYAEKDAYEFEQVLDEKAIWVAKEYGDGFGYDILSYDNEKNKEVLLEVKSGESAYFELTENEYNTMINAHLKNADYIICKYTVIGNTYISVSTYTYDPETGLLTDELGRKYILQPKTYGNNEKRYVRIRQ